MGADMKYGTIAGVEVIEKKQIKDERGMVMHMIRSDSPEFESFGEVYFSVVNPGVIKGWKLHRIISQNLVVPYGSVNFVLYDNRPGSQTFGNIQQIKIGRDDYKLLHIPPGIWYAFSNLSSEPSIITNCATHVHDMSEVEVLPLANDTIPFNFN